MANDVTISFNGQPSSLLAAFQQLTAASDQFQQSADRVSSSGEQTTSMLGRFGSAVSGMLSPLQGFGMQLAQIFETMTLWRIMEQVTNAIRDMTDAWFELNNQTEKNIYTWKYLLPGGMTAANAMAQWTMTESMQVPYTRQDMLSAITTLAGLNMNSQDIQTYLPMLASLGATRAPNSSLSDISRYIAGAEYGRSMMLKYELHINPADLVPYGYKMGKGGQSADESTFLPALMKWSEAKGYYTNPQQNAASDIAHSTFWGAWSSFLDRIQNFQLDFGGSGFAQIKVLLNDISSWIDNNQAKINQVADAIGVVLAGGIRAAANAAKEFVQGAASGQGGSFFASLGAMASGGVKETLNLLGGFLAGLGQSDAGAALTGMFQAIANTLDNPNVQKSIQALGALLGMGLGTGIAAGAALLTAIANTLTVIANHQTTMDLFIGALVGLAAIQIPALVVGFGAWAVAAGAAAVATWTATIPILGVEAPIVAVVAVIAALVAGLILLVQHWGDVTKTLGGWWNDLSTWFKNLAAQAWNWGADFVKNLVAGIGHVWDTTGGAVLNGIAGAFKAKLGHSKPTEGPMHDDDVWMVDMMRSFATQIDTNLPLVAAASNRAALAIGAPFAAAGSLGGTSYGGSYATTTSTSYGGNTIYGASDTYIRQLINNAQAASSAQAVVRARQPGGFRRPGGVLTL